VTEIILDEIRAAARWWADCIRRRPEQSTSKDLPFPALEDSVVDRFEAELTLSIQRAWNTIREPFEVPAAGRNALAPGDMVILNPTGPGRGILCRVVAQDDGQRLQKCSALILDPLSPVLREAFAAAGIENPAVHVYGRISMDAKMWIEEGSVVASKGNLYTPRAIFLRTLEGEQG